MRSVIKTMKRYWRAGSKTFPLLFQAHYSTLANWADTDQVRSHHGSCAGTFHQHQLIPSRQMNHTHTWGPPDACRSCLHLSDCVKEHVLILKLSNFPQKLNSQFHMGWIHLWRNHPMCLFPLCRKLHSVRSLLSFGPTCLLEHWFKDPFTVSTFLPLEHHGDWAGECRVLQENSRTLCDSLCALSLQQDTCRSHVCSCWITIRSFVLWWLVSRREQFLDQCQFAVGLLLHRWLILQQDRLLSLCRHIPLPSACDQMLDSMVALQREKSMWPYCGIDPSFKEFESQSLMH